MGADADKVPPTSRPAASSASQGNNGLNNSRLDRGLSAEDEARRFRLRRPPPTDVPPDPSGFFARPGPYFGRSFVICRIAAALIKWVGPLSSRIASTPS